MKARIAAGIGLVFLLCTFAAVDISAATLVVTKTADTADGVCDADCSLREAVVAAATGDTVMFSALFNTPQTITLLNGQIAFSKNLTITGPGANLLTVSGNNASRIFSISGGVTVSLSGMTLRDGFAGNAIGGAILVFESTLTLSSMTLRNNVARIPEGPTFFGQGGGIYASQSALVIENSHIDNNTAVDGGGIVAEPGNGVGSVQITSSTVNNNIGEGILAGGFGSHPITLTITGSTFDGNSTRGIVTATGTFTIISSTISRNDEGGIGILSPNAIFMIDRCIITNNESLGSLGTVAGGISTKGLGVIKNSIISGNRVTGKGGGVFNTGNLSIINTAVINNRSWDGGGGIFSAIRQLSITNSTISGNVVDDGSGGCNCPGCNCRGGGIYNLVNEVNPGGTVILTNSTVSNNRSTGLGGGLRNDQLGTATFRNTIIAGNLANGTEKDLSGTVVSEGFNLVGVTTGSTGWIGSDILNQNALLAPLGSNGGATFTHALMSGSPALNAGNNALAVDPVTKSILKTDQRGYDRFVGKGGIIDIGAHESNIASSLVTLSGRIRTLSGRGIFSTLLTLTDASSNTIYTQTNSSGYFHFRNLPPGATYTLNVFNKSFQFTSPITVTVDNNRSDMDFVALP